MTEAEWLASEDPAVMLRHLFDGPLSHPRLQGRPIAVSDRKLRLFGCACMRLTRPFAADCEVSKWDLLAVEAAEKLADNPSWEASQEALEAGQLSGRQGVLWLTEDSGVFAATQWANVWAANTAAHAALLREIVGNPWRPIRCSVSGHPLGSDTVAIQNGVHTGCDCRWITPTVLSLAEAAYEERARVWKGREHDHDEGTGWQDAGHLDPNRLAVLADALEEAGCDNKRILEHLRIGPTNRHSKGCGTRYRGCAPDCPKDQWERNGPHVRGCHVIDAILGKE